LPLPAPAPRFSYLPDAGVVWPKALSFWCAVCCFLLIFGEFASFVYWFFLAFLAAFLGAILPSSVLVGFFLVTHPALWLNQVTHPLGPSPIRALLFSLFWLFASC